MTVAGAPTDSTGTKDMKTQEHYDVIIVGAGLAGCATARALAKALAKTKH